MIRKLKKQLALLLAIILATMPLAGCNAATETLVEPVSAQETLPDTFETLTQTLQTPVGLQGFALGWDADPNELIEIGVQFVTPPAVALRLLQEEQEIRPLSAQSYEDQAQEAHEAFWEQIAPLTRARSAQVEVLSEHHSLFNGVFMRVPQHMVERIAELPEVFSVMPNMQFSADLPDPGEVLSSDDFMRESLELFDMDYIHNTMGVTGESIRVAVLDTGVDYNHPRLQQYRDPATGRIRGRNFTTGNIYDIMDRNGHGTHVSGTVIALAPNVELWHYKVLNDDGLGTDAWIIAGIEAAHQNVDVMNLSMETPVTNPLWPTGVATNLAMLDGTVVVNAAGNSGPSSYSLGAPGSASLPISVASGTLGGRNNDGDTISWWSSRGPISGTFHIKPDITAPGEYIVSAVPGGRYEAWPGTSMAGTPYCRDSSAPVRSASRCSAL